MNNHRHADHGCNRCSSTDIRMCPALAGVQAPNLRQVQLHQVCSCCVTSPPAASVKKASISSTDNSLRRVRRKPAIACHLTMSDGSTLNFSRQPVHVGAMCVYRVHHVPVAEELSYHLEARSHGSWYLLGRCLAASSLCHSPSPWHEICGESAET